MTTTTSRPAAPTKARRDWWIPVSLLALTAVPALAGAARLVDLSSGRTAENARFIDLPGPIIVHMLARAQHRTGPQGGADGGRGDDHGRAADPVSRHEGLGDERGPRDEEEQSETDDSVAAGRPAGERVGDQQADDGSVEVGGGDAVRGAPHDHERRRDDRERRGHQQRTGPAYEQGREPDQEGDQREPSSVQVRAQEGDLHHRQHCDEGDEHVVDPPRPSGVRRRGEAPQRSDDGEHA